MSYFGPSDLAHLHKHYCNVQPTDPFLVRVQKPVLAAALENWLEGGPDKAGDRFAKASPITYARRDASPILLIHGTADAVVPIEQSRLLARKLGDAGARISFVTLDGAPHDFDELKDANARIAAAAARVFLADHLLKMP